jgi:hypothetical protein
MKVLGKCQLREVVQGKQEGLDSSGTFIVVAMVLNCSCGCCIAVIVVAAIHNAAVAA